MAEIKTKNYKFLGNFTYSLLILLLIGYFIFSKTFSKISINLANIPIYINEIILIISVLFFLFYIIKNRDFRIIKPNLLNIGFLIFFVIFFISLIKGLILYDDLSFTLRQSALFYYSLFFFITVFSFQDFFYQKIKILNNILLILGNILVILIFLNLVVHINIFSFLPEGFWDAEYYYCSFFLFLILANILLKNNLFLRILFSIDFVITELIIFFYSVRGEWIAIVISIIFFLILLPIFFKNKRNLKNFLVIFIVSILISITFISVKLFFESSLRYSIQTEIISLAKSINSSTEEVLLNRDISSINSKWRLITWKDMLLEVKKSPFLGYGFGKKFISKTTLEYGWTTGLKDGWVEAHNYVISFLFRSGLLGLFSFLLVIGAFFKKVFGFIKKSINDKLKIILICLLSGIVYILILGLFEVVLEVPYCGFFLWFLMGLCISIINNEDKNNLNGSINSV